MIADQLQIRIHGDASLPTLVYLPGMHGDWTLVSSFRAAVAGKTRFVEFTYPRSVTGTLDDLTREIEEALSANSIREGWLLGESFGSQPAWQIIKHSQASAGGFRPLGLILTGGFVRHPVNWAVRVARRASECVPMSIVKLFCAAYARYAKFRHKHAPETLASIAEFVANRTQEADRQAIVHRYGLIANNDLRPVARQTRFPVYYLAGLVDPLVPWPFVRWWLRRNCPGYRGGKTLWRADHNALGTQPQKSAEQILVWIAAARRPERDLELPTNPSRKAANLLS
ncbi:MAG TPA: alpha/beta hydrolase [Candidatus Angelobacter sp.]|nr:alpha/beta hydrolase [Candidatus Angelobacter sp.]